LKDEFLDELREVAKNFFALPLEEKQKYFRTVDDMEGYGNDSVLSDHQTLDWTDRLYLVVSPEEQRKLRLWPKNFRRVELSRCLINYNKSLKFNMSFDVSNKYPSLISCHLVCLRRRC